MADQTASTSSPIAPQSRLPPEARPELVLRVSVVVLLAATAVVAFVPGMHAHMVAPAVDLALDTTAFVVSVSLTSLALVRFQERREAVGLYHASAFLALAVAYGVALAVSLGRDAAPETLADPSSPQVWVFAVARILAAVLLIAGGAAMRGPMLPRHPGALLLLPAVAVLGVALAGYTEPGFAAAVSLLNHDTPPDVLPTTTPAGIVVELATATLFFVAAFVVRAAWRRDRTPMDAWIAVALVFAGFGELHWLMYPSGHPGHVASADLLRLACYVALLLGIEAEARVTVARLRATKVQLEALRDVEVERAAIEERSRLARELHDGLAQDLWLAKLKTGQIASVPGLPSQARPLLDEAEAAINNGLTEARQAVLALRLATIGQEGFCSLMQRFVEDFEDRFGLRVEFSCLGDPGSVAPRTQAEILRIAQEALTNARQHASPTVVGVRLAIHDGRVTLRIADNGCGFDTSTTVSDAFGLVSMRERAELLGGRLHVRSRPGEGTTVHLAVPASGVRPRGLSAEVPA